MKLLKDASSLTNALLLAVCALMAILSLSIYLDQRADLVNQRDIAVHNLNDAESVMKKQAELQEFLAGPGVSMMDDASTVERRLLHLVHDWEQQTGVQEASFLRSAAVSDHSFARLTFEVTVNGSLPAVAALLYRVETSPEPLRVDNSQMRRVPGSANVEIHLTISALCKRGSVTAESL